MTDSGCLAGEGARRPSEGGGVGGSQRVPTRRPERACGQRSAARRAGTRCPDEAAVHVPARPASSSPPGTRQVSGRVSGQALKQARAAVLSPSEEAPETRRELGVTAPAPLGGHGPTLAAGRRGPGGRAAGGQAGALLPRGSRGPSGLSGDVHSQERPRSQGLGRRASASKNRFFDTVGSFLLVESAES